MTFVLRRALLASAAMGALSRPYDPFEGTIAHIYEPGRRTLTSYTGNLVRLRRASDDAEADFGYVAATGELDTAAIAAWAGGAAYVVTVYDQKGGDAITQAVALSQPLYVASAQNGHAGMLLDGINHYIQGAWSSALSQPLNVYAVVDLADAELLDASNADICDGYEANKRMVLMKSSTYKYGMFLSATVLGSGLNANPTLWAGLFNGAASNLLANTASVVAGNPGAQDVTGLTIGANYEGNLRINAGIHSLIVCTAQTAGQRATTQAAINAYWGLY